MDPIYTEQISENLRLEIVRDDDPTNPRENCNVGVMVCEHQNYKLGDKTLGELGLDKDDFASWDDIAEALTKENAAVVLPLYLYDHSGITMYTTGNTDYHQYAGWDSGQVGLIYCTQDQVKDEWGGDLAAATERLKGEVKEYNDYLTGNCYGYQVIKTETCNLGETHETTLDSCWGFLDDKQYAIDEGKAAAEYYKKEATQ